MFITTMGDDEYLVRPFGVSSAVFQLFINDVLQDMIGQFVIDYIVAILTYLPDYNTHVQQVCQVLQHL